MEQEGGAHKKADKEMRRVFNLGIGLVLVISKDTIEETREKLSHLKPGHTIIARRKTSSKEEENRVNFTW